MQERNVAFEGAFDRWAGITGVKSGHVRARLTGGWAMQKTVAFEGAFDLWTGAVGGWGWRGA